MSTKKSSLLDKKRKTVLKGKRFDEYLKENYDAFFEKSFRLNSAQLFGLSLNTVKTLKLSIKSFDTLKGQIIAVDRFRNIVIMQILNQNKQQSKVKMFGYSSVFGKTALKKTTTNLLTLLSEKNKN